MLPVQFNLQNVAATRVYHITHVSNIPKILAAGHLLSDQLLLDQGSPQASIGHSNIKDLRLNLLKVDCCGDRFVGEFVPFYFCTRTTMLYTINIGQVPNRPPGSQREIVYFVTTVGNLTELGAEWAFSDGAANRAYPPRFWNDLAALPRLDWQAIGLTYWGDKGHQKHAEFLVADRVPWVALKGIACFDDTVRTQVVKMLATVPNAPKVLVKRDWYF